MQESFGTFSENQTKLDQETLFFFNLKRLHTAVTLNISDFETIHITQLREPFAGVMSRFFTISLPTQLQMLIGYEYIKLIPVGYEYRY